LKPNHFVFLEGVYLDRTAQGLKTRFIKVEPPTDADIAMVLQKISRRVVRMYAIWDTWRRALMPPWP